MVGTLIKPFVHQPRKQTQNNQSLIKECSLVASSLGKRLNICFINEQSVRNKSNILADYILVNDFDIFCIAKTWLLDTDTQELVHLVSADYVVIRRDRKGQ